MSAPESAFPRSAWGTDNEPEADDLTTQERHRGQLRFAERFVREHNGRLLHVHGIGWHYFDGARWAECQNGGEMRAVKDTIQTAVEDLQALDGDPRKELMRDIAKVESFAGMNGILGIAGTLNPCTAAATDLDSDPYLLNTLSGTVDLRSGRVRSPRPADQLSKVTGGAFDPDDAESEVFDRFLAQIHPELETRSFLGRSLGSSLLGLVREQHLLLWFGTGANGKGTLRDAVLHAMGEYGVEVPADILLASKYGASHLAPERMRLKGARIAFCSEIADGARMDEATMKKLTGGDPVQGKFLYRNPITFDPSHTLVMLTNFLPVVRGDDPAVWRRILAVPFEQVILPEERDPQLPEKLKGCPDAVLAWLWRGWLDYQRQGLNPPKAVLDATKKYEHDSDILARFLDDESAVIRGHGSVPSDKLYKAFQDWTRAQGEPCEMTNRAFTEALEKRGFTRRRANTGRWWTGISLVSNADKDDEDDEE